MLVFAETPVTVVSHLSIVWECHAAMRARGTWNVVSSRQTAKRIPASRRASATTETRARLETSHLHPDRRRFATPQ